MSEDVSGCYWERLKGLSGEFDDILANGNVSGQALVDVLPTDVAFASQRCGAWKPFVPFLAPVDTMGEGSWAVNGMIAPGRYRSSGARSCYWERVRNFSGGFDAILANNNSEGDTIVDILPGDGGFTSTRCGTWTKVG